jgi:hypothetical protein
MRAGTPGRALCLACAGLLVAVASAHAAATTAIVPGKSIGGAVLGMTPAQVSAALGAPPQTFEAQFVYGADKLIVDFDLPTAQAAATVRSVWTASRSFRTAKRIGVGSRFEALRSAYPALICNVRTGKAVKVYAIRKVPRAAAAGAKVDACGAIGPASHVTTYQFGTPGPGFFPRQGAGARLNRTIQLVFVTHSPGGG